MRLQSKTYRAVVRMAAAMAGMGCAAGFAGPTPRLTPKPQSVRAYPAPSVPVPSQAGVLGPYGVGLAAAAPVGTPYLRSPAFAGPSIIYMPQSVTRVLVPGTTPYPSNIMQTTDRYIYSSAPFNRTDVYVNLPYGGFYRPQGFAGTTPVEPQVPAYVAQPISAVLTAEANYSSGNFVSEGRSDMVPTTDAALSVAPAAGMSSEPAAAPAMTPANPAGLTSMQAFPAQPDSPGTVSPLPSTTPAPTSLAPAATPAPDTNSMPSLSSASPSAGGLEIIVDDSQPANIRQEPAGSWTPSVNVADSYQGGSLIAKADGTPKSVTFLADIPSDGEYEIGLWYVISNQAMRSTTVPVTVTAADGEKKVTVDQVSADKRRNFVSIGKFNLKAGQKVPVVKLSTEGLPAAGTIYVSADAVRLVKVQ